MIESYCKRCGEIYLREIYDYEINEQNKNYHEFQIKTGKYSSRKYYIEKLHCEKYRNEFKKEYEEFLNNKEIFKFKKIGIMRNGVYFSINDIDFIICFGLGYTINFKNGKKFNIYDIDIVEQSLVEKYSNIFKVYSADGRKEVLGLFYGNLLEEKEEDSLQILISKLEKMGFERGDELKYTSGYPVFRHKDFIIKKKNYQDRECFYKVNTYEPI